MQEPYVAQHMATPNGLGGGVHAGVYASRVKDDIGDVQLVYSATSTRPVKKHWKVTADQIGTAFLKK
eukprot:NODE_7374_length_322_cov_17.769231_g6637_i0.p2 GENE.NODE_7374_length_322_cov_17.769231_g6637_i0~~NODE_7374_length_322_cov_17.769231_g6637_i0.p2  ORF type:complete len:67 (+),score=12.05 NODE_7374_length_322_cov_17.769231_g6637_i0:65-265(+)